MTTNRQTKGILALALNVLKFPFLTILFFGSVAHGDTFEDAFSKALNPIAWRVISNSPLYRVEAVDAGVRLSTPAGGTYSFQYAGLEFSPRLRGNFDLAVDFTNASIARLDGSPGNQIQLNTFFGGQDFLLVRSDEAGSGQNVHVWLWPQAAFVGQRAHVNPSGRLRITRVGSHTRASADGILIFEGDYNTNDVTVTLTLQNNGTRDATSVTFANFVVTADHILPRLDIRRGTGIDLMLSWPAPATGWKLQVTTNLLTGGSVWREIPPPYPISGANLQVTDTMRPGHAYYRLRKP